MILERRGAWLSVRVGNTTVLDVWMDDPLLRDGLDLAPYLERAGFLGMVDDMLRYGG